MLRARILAIDHRHEYAEGGVTDAANGEVLCDHHNQLQEPTRLWARRTPKRLVDHPPPRRHTPPNPRRRRLNRSTSRWSLEVLNGRQTEYEFPFCARTRTCLHAEYRQFGCAATFGD